MGLSSFPLPHWLRDKLNYWSRCELGKAESPTLTPEVSDLALPLTTWGEG